MQLTNLYLALSAISLGTTFAVPAKTTTPRVSTVTAWTSTSTLPGWTSTSTLPGWTSTISMSTETETLLTPAAITTAYATYTYTDTSSPAYTTTYTVPIIPVFPMPTLTTGPFYPFPSHTFRLKGSSSNTSADGEILQHAGVGKRHRVGFGITGDGTQDTELHYNARTGSLYMLTSAGKRRQLAVTSSNSSVVRALLPGVGAPLSCELNAKDQLKCFAVVICNELLSTDYCKNGVASHFGVVKKGGIMALVGSSQKIPKVDGVSGPIKLTLDREGVVAAREVV